MFLLEDHLHQIGEMKDEIEAKKKLTPRRLPSQKKNSVRESFINSFFTRATQHTVRFIRWCVMDYHEKLSLPNLTHRTGQSLGL